MPIPKYPTMHKNSKQPTDDLIRDDLIDLPGVMTKNVNGDILSIEFDKEGVKVKKTWSGYTAGDVVTETIVFTAWEEVP